jgi:ElaB/YqjD/DUF883 family membrane-anchored ribosome-binding protein
MDKNDVGTTAHRAEETLDSLKETVKGFVDQGAQKVDAIKTKVVEAKEQAITRGSVMLDRMTDMIRAHPLKSVGVAFGAGYLAMRLFRR